MPIPVVTSRLISITALVADLGLLAEEWSKIVQRER